MGLSPSARSRPVLPVVGLGVALALTLALLSQRNNVLSLCQGAAAAQGGAAAAQGGALAAAQQAEDAESQPAEQQKHDYVLAVSLRVNEQYLSIFVQSWKRWSPATRLVVFTDDAQLSPHVRFLFAQFDVEVVKFELPPGNAVHVYRFHLFKQFVEERAAGIRGVVLSDIKDVVVQSNPWAHPDVAPLLRRNALLFSLEGGTQLGPVAIQHDTWNAKWQKDCFGEEMAARLGPETISCSGVTIGAGGAVRSYLATMIEAIENKVTDACRARADDQAVHIYLLYVMGPAGELPFEYEVRANLESPVHTVGLGFPVNYDLAGRLVREGGGHPAMLHQYNRHRDMVALYKGMYPFGRQYRLNFNGTESLATYVGPHKPEELAPAREAWPEEGGD